MMQEKRKVYAYITHGMRLLVLEHADTPEAGIQVPGGSLEDDEEPAAGVLREAKEETGLDNLTLVSFLGEQYRDWREHGLDRIDHRYFYHLRCTGDVPERWRHYELTPSDGTPGPVPFNLYWLPLSPQTQHIVVEHGALLPRLLEVMPGFERD